MPAALPCALPHHAGTLSLVGMSRSCTNMPLSVLCTHASRCISGSGRVHGRRNPGVHRERKAAHYVRLERTSFSGSTSCSATALLHVSRPRSRIPTVCVCVCRCVCARASGFLIERGNLYTHVCTHNTPPTPQRTGTHVSTQKHTQHSHNVRTGKVCVTTLTI